MNSWKKLVKQMSSLAVAIMLLFPLASFGQDGQALFSGTCGACHTIGKGRSVGPDLMGVNSRHNEEWLLKWVKSSSGLIASGDADAKALFAKFNIPMPDQNLKDEEIKSILTYISSKSPSASATASVDTSNAAPKADASLTASAEQIELGRKIFLGQEALTNGGPGCISCHNVNYKDMIPGGLLAKDLTNVYSRLGGDAGILGILGAPPFPAMTQAYKDRAITEKEIAAVTAFLSKVDRDKANEIASTQNPLLVGGTFGLIVLLALIFVLWFARKKTSTKKDIYDRQLKSY